MLPFKTTGGHSNTAVQLLPHTAGGCGLTTHVLEERLRKMDNFLEGKHNDSETSISYPQKVLRCLEIAVEVNNKTLWSSFSHVTMTHLWVACPLQGPATHTYSMWLVWQSWTHKHCKPAAVANLNSGALLKKPIIVHQNRSQPDAPWILHIQTISRCQLQ